MALIEPYLENVISRFEALRDAAPADDRTTMQFLVDHEVALLRFVQLERSGADQDSTRDARTLIERVPEPGTCLMAGPDNRRSPPGISTLTPFAGLSGLITFSRERILRSPTRITMTERLVEIRDYTVGLHPIRGLSGVGLRTGGPLAHGQPGCHRLLA